PNDVYEGNVVFAKEGRLDVLIQVVCDGKGIDKADGYSQLDPSTLTALIEGFDSQNNNPGIDFLQRDCSVAKPNDHPTADIGVKPLLENEFDDDFMELLNDEESLPKVSLDDINVDEQEEKLIDTVKVESNKSEYVNVVTDDYKPCLASVFAQEQPLPLVVSPTAESPGYVTESDPEEDPEEYEDDETEDGPVDYPMDGGEDGDDDDGDSSGDDADDEDEEDKDEVEEHLAPADFAVVVPTVELVSPPKEKEPVTQPPSTDITTAGVRITVRLQASISLPPEAEVERLLAMPTPPPSPPISLSPPSAGERLAKCTTPSAHSSPPPVPSPLLPSSGCPTQIQTLRIASTQALVDAVTAALPSPPLPPSLYVPPPIDRRDDIPESELPLRKRSCLSTLGPMYKVRESSTARPTGGRGIDYGFVSTVDAEARRRRIREVGYGIRDTWVDPAEAVPEIARMTVGKDSRTRISQRVTMDSQLVDLLMKDRIAHQETVLIVEEEAYASREAWAHSVGLSQAVHYELQTHREHVYMRREMGDTQAELLALREQQRRARQPGPDVRAPDQQDAYRDADSHI
ncbi:hypothetical protein Tco_1277969, partial [Tanacetum coccineum]